MQNKKLMKRSVAAGLAGILALGAFNGIGAYFTSTSSASDTYTVGKVEIELSGSDNDFAKTKLLPLQEYEYTRKVTNTGLNDAFVFMTVSIPYIETDTLHDDDGNVIELNNDAGDGEIIFSPEDNELEIIPIDPPETETGQSIEFTQVLTYGLKGDKDTAKAGVNSKFQLIENGRVGDISISEVESHAITGVSDTHGAVDKDNKCITYVYAYADETGKLTALEPEDDTGFLFDTLKVANLADAANMKAAGDIKINAYAIQTMNVLEPSAFTGKNDDGSVDMEEVWAVVQNACSVESTNTPADDEEEEEDVQSLLTNENDGAQQSMINIAGVDYRVLAVEDNKALLLQDKVDPVWNKDLDTKYSDTYSSGPYEDSYVDTYLEGTLYPQLKAQLGENAIVGTTLTAADTSGINQYDDDLIRHVFALSIQDIVNSNYGFMNNWEPFNWDAEDEHEYYSSGTAGEDEARIALDESGTAVYWLTRSTNSLTVSSDGSIRSYRADRTTRRVRPAFYLNLDEVIISGENHQYTAIAK